VASWSHAATGGHSSDRTPPAGRRDR
jgi:hypothetical protein